MQLLPFVSVIIPTRPNLSAVQPTLERLGAQTYPSDRFEILVVVNGEGHSLLPASLSTAPQIRYLQQVPSGSYRARNRGVLEARGEVIAFTDSDCLPDTRWLMNGVEKLLAEPSCGLVAGRILPLKEKHPLTPIHSYQLLDFFPQDFYVRECHFGATANLFTKREVFDSVGMFLGSLYSGGDLEWGERVSKYYSLHYAPEVIIQHPLRKNFRSLLQKELRQAGGVGARNRLVPSTLYRPEKKISRKVRRLLFRFKQIGNDAELNFKLRFEVLGLLLFFQAVWCLERWRVYWGGSALNG